MMKNFYLLFLMLAATACSENPYGDYKGNRAKAQARCDELGYQAGDANYYSCVSKEYTRITQSR